MGAAVAAVLAAEIAATAVAAMAVRAVLASKEMRSAGPVPARCSE
ncbi:hypothetical protein HNQ70_003753 [Quisquiliibacterium transsilvanicum]|uniref:Uncharacterized protein n=1 Tax=Quisquiliibacterium transsilvanicum TaxID=1549638 RepID=A0A7W8HKF9_9BURK|nr:hypothetical protein [Quisquiliibacterium transsilvanicum]